MAVLDLAPEGGRWLVACRLDQLVTRSILPVELDGRDLVVIRTGSCLLAAERACPHDRADLALGHCRDGRLHCPRHRASFDLDSGAVSGGWDVAALQIYEAKTHGEDVFVRVG